MLQIIQLGKFIFYAFFNILFFKFFWNSQGGYYSHRCHELVNHLEESVLNFYGVLGLDGFLHHLVQVSIDVHSHLYSVFLVDLERKYI